MTRMTTRLFLLPALALAWFVQIPALRADAIDQALFRCRKELREKLQEHNYKNVGVLKFEVQRGEGQPTLQMGRLNGLMANRLENILILCNDDQNPIGVTRAAGDVAAAADPEANFSTEDGVRKLLKGEYPLAWGTKKVSVDALLTGRVQLAKDLSKATISILAFDKNHVAKPEEICKITDIPVTRGLLSEMNLAFLVSRGVVSTKLDDEESPDTSAVKERLRLEETRSKPKLEEVLDFKVYYDGEPVEPVADDRLPTPKKGQKVHFELAAKEKLSLVIRVNGINTADGDKAEKAPEKYSKWVLEPNERYEIRGIYSDGQVSEFTTVDPKEAQAQGALMVQNKIGKIEIDLFRAGSARPKEQRAKEKDYNLAEPIRAAGTPAEAKEMVANLVEREPKGRNVIVGKDKKEAELETTRFDSQHAGTFVLIYYMPEIRRIGPPPVQK